MDLTAVFWEKNCSLLWSVGDEGPLQGCIQKEFADRHDFDDFFLRQPSNCEVGGG